MNQLGCYSFSKELGKNKSGNIICEYVCRSCGELIKPTRSDVNKNRVKGKCKNPDFILKRKILNNIYWNMVARCHNSKSENYKYYGGKGISVCERWLNSFENFYEDVSPSYREGLWLDRVDGCKNYSYDNCRWVNISEQQHNKKKTEKNCTSKYKGVSLIKDSNKWKASISKNKTRITIGSFDSEEEAAKAYNIIAEDLGIEENLNDVDVELPKEAIEKMRDRFEINL